MGYRAAWIRFGGFREGPAGLLIFERVEPAERPVEAGLGLFIAARLEMDAAELRLVAVVRALDEGG